VSQDAKPKRERERERCDSAKLAHLATAFTLGACTLTTYLPAETTLNKLPLRKPTRPLSRKTPSALGTVDHHRQTPNQTLCLSSVITVDHRGIAIISGSVTSCQVPRAKSLEQLQSHAEDHKHCYLMQAFSAIILA
jgi:hypothetical protein